MKIASLCNEGRDEDEARSGKVSHLQPERLDQVCINSEWVYLFAFIFKSLHSSLLSSCFVHFKRQTCYLFIQFDSSTEPFSLFSILQHSKQSCYSADTSPFITEFVSIISISKIYIYIYMCMCMCVCVCVCM